MKYKAVILDMDGTLLDDRKEITSDNMATLKKLNEMGILIMVATGRRYAFTKKVLEKLGFNVIVLSNSGNTIWELETDRKIAAVYLDERVYRGILEEGYKMNLHPVLHVDMYDSGIDTVTRYAPENPVYKGYIREGDSRHRVIADLDHVACPNVMLMCYAADIDTLARFQERVHSKFEQSIHSHITLSLGNIGPLLEISHKKGTKWHSALNYLAGRNITAEEVIAIGDDSNDLNMIKGAGLGIAMKNAIREIKEAADIITEYDNNNSGVAKVLNEIFRLNDTGTGQ